MNDKWKIRVWIGLGIIGYILLLIISFFILKDFFLLKKEDTIPSYGQLLADWILLPTAIVLFIIAINEFRKTQVKPKLFIFWAPDRGILIEKECFVLRSGKDDARYYKLMLQVGNEGPIVAPSFRVTVELPRELIGFSEHTHKFNWIDDWSNQGNLERKLLEFQSDGNNALYPGQQVHIATLDFTVPPNNKSMMGKIRFSLAANNVKIEKQQEIRIEKEDLANMT